MLLSVYSVCMATLFSWSLVCFLRAIFRRPKFARTLHPDFLTLLVWMCFFRLFFPCSFLIGFHLPWDDFFEHLDRILDDTFLLDMTGYGWLAWIWLAGACVALWLDHSKGTRGDALVDLILDGAEKKKISDFIPDYLGPDYDLYLCPNLQSSFVIGRSRRIFLPKSPMTPEEYEIILLHEVMHLANDDGMYCWFLDKLKIVYWWFPPIYTFRPVFDLFYEIRVDLMVNANYTPQHRLDYSKALLKFSAPSSAFIQLSPDTQPIAMPFGAAKREPLEMRVRYLLEPGSSDNLKTHPGLILLLLLITFLSALILISVYSI